MVWSLKTRLDVEDDDLSLYQEATGYVTREWHDQEAGNLAEKSPRNNVPYIIATLLTRPNGVEWQYDFI